LTCSGCGTQLEGTFDVPPILRLSAEDIDFVVNFVRVSGSLKEMAKLQGQSYPTIRNRLNELIARLDATEETAEQRRHKILDAIAKGEISAKEGARQLKEVSG
jgi:hypothetical protein